MIINLIIMIAVFVSYVSYIWYKYGILKSISDSYYHLPKNRNILFTFFCWGFSIPVVIMSGIMSTELLYLAAASIMFVGVASNFKENITRQVHYIGAISSVIFSQISLILDFKLWELSIIFMILSSLLLIFRKKINYKHIWWIEILAFTSIIIGIVKYII